MKNETGAAAFAAASCDTIVKTIVKPGAATEAATTVSSSFEF